MNPIQISHAQALRVIGQQLGEVGTSLFQISKVGNDYIVLTHPHSAAQISARKQESSTARTARSQPAPRRPAEAVRPLRFPLSDIPVLDTRALSKRSNQVGMADLFSLSSSLRVLGGYLDRQRIEDFTLSWRIDSVTVATDKKEHTFSVHQNLHDLGVPMYLNRSNGFIPKK